MINLSLIRPRTGGSGWGCRFLAGLALAGAALTFVADGAFAASTTTLTATAVHITDHPANGQTVVDFSGPALAANRVQAPDPNPSDGTAGLLVSRPGATTRVSRATAHGVSVRVFGVPGGLRIVIGALPGAFKYLSYSIRGSHQLAVDVWKTTFPPAGDISHGQGNCLTLGHVSATPGTVTAGGTAGGLFEHHFRVVLRDAFGRVLAARSLSASGRWSVALRYIAPQGQGGYFDAAASSAKDGALACLVQRAFALPASNRRANLSVVYRAYADVNGDGRRDLVTLRHISTAKGQLTVALAGDGRLSVTTASDAKWLPGLVATGNVDGRPGEELFIDVQHITTAEGISIYTYWHRRLVKAGTLSAYGYDYGVLYGVTCSARGARHFITQHSFYIRFGTRQWMRQDTAYVWRGPALKLFASRPAKRIPGQPSPALVGVQCGHLPLAAPASTGTVPGRPVPAGVRPASVSFVSVGTGFVLGAVSCAHPPCTIVLRTLDRGRSWRSLSAPGEAISMPEGNGLWGLRFADARRGYAYGAGLWLTRNGAAGWQPMKMPGRTVLAFAAVQDRELVAAMTACRSVGCPRGVALYQRPIRAGVWKRFAVNTSRGTAFDTAIAVHRGVVWVLAGYDLYVSTDGGRSFHTHNQPCHPPHRGMGIPSPGGITDDGTHTYLLCLGSGTPDGSRSTSTGPAAPHQPGARWASRPPPAARRHSPPAATRRS